MSYKAGTVTTVANNATITGANTQWANSLYNVVKGQIIVITQGTNTDIYTIEEVKSNTSILLSRPAVRSATNATYEILTTLNNSVSDDTIKLGNEIVAMSDFMRIMQAWTTGTQNTVKVTWGSQEITIATVAGLQSQINEKMPLFIPFIPDKTDILAYFASGKRVGFYRSGVDVTNVPVRFTSSARYEWVPHGDHTASSGTLHMYTPYDGSFKNSCISGVWSGWEKEVFSPVTSNISFPDNVRGAAAVNSRFWKIDSLYNEPLIELRDALQGQSGISDEYMILGWGSASSSALADPCAIFGTITASRGATNEGNVPAVCDIIYQDAYNDTFCRIVTRGGRSSAFQGIYKAWYKGNRVTVVKLDTSNGRYSGGATFTGSVIYRAPFDKIGSGGMFTVVRASELTELTEIGQSQLAAYKERNGSMEIQESLRISNSPWPGITLVHNDLTSMRMEYKPASVLELVKRDVGGGNQKRVFIRPPAGAENNLLSTDDILSLKGYLAYGGLIPSGRMEARGDRGGADVNFADDFPIGVTAGITSLKDFSLGNDGYSYGALATFRGWNDATGAGACGQILVTSVSIAGRNGYKNADNKTQFFAPWVAWTNKNTTKDSNGNLKAASPIVKVFAEHIETNDEAEGVTMQKLGVGHYLIKGVVGFNTDGAWGINNGFVIPQDHNGKNMVLIDYEVKPDGDIELFVFHQQNADMPERFQNKRIKHIDEDGNPVYYENYEPCDVPESRWIDMRVEMPVNSIYNLKQAEAKAEAERLAKEEAEAERLAKEETDRQTEEAEESETQPDDM
ncbi:hypothetical protein [Providencia phage Kokobel2]|nr:hypothetical protein [Providencia phage Kokobel2]